MWNNFKEISELTIYKDNEIAGKLRRTPEGCQFQLTTEFITQNSVPFSYCIKNEPEPVLINGDSLPPFFAGLLPEGRRFNLLIKKLKTSEDDLFSLLALVGADCIGDIDIGIDELHTSNQIPSLNEVNFYDFFNETLNANSSMIDTKALAGVQEKISASMISFPLSIAKKNKAYILKLNPPDKANLIQNEFLCLQLAKKCGFKVANASIVHDKENNPGLLVERFDRYKAKKLHQEDACQFLNRYPADKYRLSMKEIADGLSLITQAPQIEVLNLLRQYTFSYLIGNGDLHAKNISLQTLENNITTLTPLYDLICTSLYGDYHMALKIDGRDANITRKTILAFAARYSINEKATHSAIDKMLETFDKHYHLLLQIPMDEKKKVFVEQFILKRMEDLR